MAARCGDQHLSVAHRGTAVDVAAAERNVERQRVVVFPEGFTGLRVDSPDVAIGAGQIHDVVDDDRGASNA